MLGVVLAGTATRHGRLGGYWVDALVGRPRGRRAVEDILISILTELLFSSTTLPFRVRWYSGRIIPPIHNTLTSTHTPQQLIMMKTIDGERIVALPLTEEHSYVVDN